MQHNNNQLNLSKKNENNNQNHNMHVLDGHHAMLVQQ